MNKFAALMIAVAVLALCGSPAASAADTQATTHASTDSLFDQVSALDTAAFDAFNHCSSPAQLQKHASYFAPDVEFYHDTGGVTWTRKEMIDKTRQNVCGHFRRELVPGSLKVFPIKRFGAIEQGVHRFCQFDTGKCDGIADFIIVWRHQGDTWQITRVLSYGHRATE
ncbi:MAG: nuclear transport factor 2 family protein [Rhodanobacter sp.]